MSEVLPISCISCRRRKIKCNKLKPCNQCQKRRIVCQFPSTFRNIKIDENELEANELSINEDRNRSKSSSSVSNNSGSSSSNQSPNNPTDITKLNEEIELLRNEKLTILQDNFKLNQKNHQLLTQISKFDRSTNLEHSKPSDSKNASHDHFPISGETSEMGEKYYGPQSSNFMIETLKKKLTNDESLRKVKYLKPNDLINFGDSSSETKYSSDIDKSNDHDQDDDSNLTHDSISGNLIERSLLKKPLPFLLKIDPELSSDSDTSFDLLKLNFRIIYKMVELFFINTTYYKSFISKETVFNFLNNYESIKDKEWENDDDLLLLYMILLLSIQRLTPKEFIDMNLMSSSNDSIKKFKKFKNHLLNNILYHNFEKLRHNLINESIITIQAYILCTEWYFIDQRYEESWSMLFHTCSIAYSIGLHVMGKFRTTTDNEHSKIKSENDSMIIDDDESKKIKNKIEKFDYEPSDEDNDIARFKVWFALKNISGQICSVLGRPNPISIQVNSIVLKSSSESNLSKIDLNAHKTQVLLKIGLSECLRLSNMMLIENFMINFTMNDLLNLDSKFEKEINLLEWFLSDKYTDDDLIDSHNNDDLSKLDGDSSGGDQLSYDEGNYLPLRIDRVNLIIDLITLYINRAKLFEPFINQFQEASDAALITKSLLYSIMKFLDYIIEFIQQFLDNFADKYLAYEYQIMSEIKFGKLFRIYYPFLNSFIYQGIIVIFTFLNYKSNDFVYFSVHSNESSTTSSDSNIDEPKNASNSNTATVGPSSNPTIDYNSFLQKLENKLNALLQFDLRISRLLNQSVRLWSTNIVYLINKNIQAINLIYEKQKIEKQKLDDDLNDLKNQIDPPISSASNNVQPDLGNELSGIPSTNTNNPVTNISHPSNVVHSNSVIPPHTNLTDDEPGLDNLLGFNMRDPFWLTNPDNLPYYLSSPSDDGDSMPNKKPKTDSDDTTKQQAQQSNKHLTFHPQPLNQTDSSGLFNLDNLTLGNQVTNFGNLYQQTHDSLVVGMPSQQQVQPSTGFAPHLHQEELSSIRQIGSSHSQPTPHNQPHHSSHSSNHPQTHATTYNMFDPSQPTGVFQTYQGSNANFQLFNQQMDVNARPHQHELQNQPTTRRALQKLSHSQQSAQSQSSQQQEKQLQNQFAAVAVEPSDSNSSGNTSTGYSNNPSTNMF